MNKKIKVGIIGAGAIVESSHIPVLKVQPNVSIEWVYDRDVNRSELVSRMFHIPYTSGDNIESDIDNIDVCLITIPYGARKKFIELCAEKKKAVYVEKPFATSLKEHTYYCGLFPSQDLAVGFQRRYYQAVELLKKIVSSNIFGKLISIQFRQGYFTLKGNKEFLSNAALAGGGVIIESAIHTLDQILMITDAEKINVTELRSLVVKGIDYDTEFRTELVYKTNPIEVRIEISTLRNLDNGVRFIFENAIVSCGMSPDEKAKIYDPGGRPISLDLELINISGNERNQAKSISASFYSFWSDFLEAIYTQKPNKTSAINSLLTTAWVEQVYEKINKTS